MYRSLVGLILMLSAFTCPGPSLITSHATFFFLVYFTGMVEIIVEIANLFES